MVLCFIKKYNAMPANLKLLRKTLIKKNLLFSCSRCSLELDYICAMAYLKPCQTSAMSVFGEINTTFEPFIFAGKFHHKG